MASLKDYTRVAQERGISKKEITDTLLDKGYSRNEISEAFSEKIISKRDTKQFKEISYLEKIKLLFSNPTGFFDEVREDNIKKSLFLIVITYLVYILFSIGISLILRPFFGPLNPLFFLSGSSYSYLSYIIYAVLFTIAILGTFVYSGICHLTLKLMGHDLNYSQTYNVITYSLIPSVILSIIPLVGLFSFIYSIILMVFGFSSYYNISKGKAVVVVLLPLIIIFGLVIIFILWLFFSLVQRGSLF